MKLLLMKMISYLKIYIKLFHSQLPLFLFLIYLLLLFIAWTSKSRILEKLRYNLGQKEIYIKTKEGYNLKISLETLYYLIRYLQDTNNENTRIRDSFLIQKDYIKIPLNRDYLLALIEGWSFDNNYWIYKDIKFHDITYTAVEVFNENTYDIDVNDKEVVDIGASIGDSSIYFTLKGAKKVIAVEPLPSVYEDLVYNIKINHLEDKIVAINAGLSDKPGKIKVPSKIDLHNTPAYSLKNEGEVEIPLITLSDILKMIKEPHLLKMDCEGCEDMIIRNDYDNLRKFQVLVFEYHFPKKRKEILKILEKDYNCKIQIGILTDLFYCYKKTH